MRLFSKLIVAFLLVPYLLSAQNVLSGVLVQAAPAPAPAKPATASDPLGRNTPSSSVLGFLKAAQGDDYTAAAQYLQLSAARRRSDGEQLARELKTVLDTSVFGGRLDTFTQEEGTPQEGVPPGRQRAATLSYGDMEVDLDLVRVADPNAGKIWLISSETLAKVPELYELVEARRVELKLPSFLVKHELGATPLWQWLALLLALPVAAAGGWLIAYLLGFPLRWWARRRGHVDVANAQSVSSPAWLVFATLAHQAFAHYLGMPLLSRHYYYQISSVALIVGAMWILWNAVRWFLHRIRNRALARGHAGTGSLILLGERIVKAAIFVAAALLILTNLGFNMTTALAGLGIGGIAIGFGAQQTIANLFGGVSILGDEVIRVGDVCTFGDRTGVVEDIGLRSTRIRTEERTLLAIPNGTVATINVENLSRRDKILFKTKLAVHAGTKADHMRYILAELRRLLYSHPRIETNSVRVRLADIAGSSLTVEVVSYILTQDFNEFAAVREDLLLRMMDIVDDSGSSLATPSQTLYLGRDPGLDKERAETAAKKIAELREKKQLPFPEYHENEIASLKGTIEYPPPESTLRNNQNAQRKTKP